MLQPLMKRRWICTVLRSPTRSSRANIKKKKCSFHYRGLECRRRKSRATWSNRQIWPWSTNWSRANLTELCQEIALVIANTLFQQHETTPHMDITRWSVLKSDWLYSLQQEIEKLHSQQKQDQEMTVAQIMNPLLQTSELNWRK